MKAFYEDFSYTNDCGYELRFFYDYEFSRFVSEERQDGYLLNRQPLSKKEYDEEWKIYNEK